jgi:uncharacterized protein (TIGR02246 family)
MKTRILGALVGLAIPFALPTYAQQTNTPDALAVTPQVRQQIEAIQVKYNEAVNKHDAAAVAALFTQDAIQAWSSSGGVDSNSGKQAIQRSYELGWEKTPFVGKVVQVYAIGNDIAAIEEWSAGDSKGYKVWVFFRDINSWKIRLQYGTLAPKVW